MPGILSSCANLTGFAPFGDVSLMSAKSISGGVVVSLSMLIGVLQNGNHDIASGLVFGIEMEGLVLCQK